LVLVAVAYAGAHLSVQSTLVTGFHPYAPFKALGIGAAGRAFTMLGMVSQWCRLLLWPARLTPEYGPPGYPVVSDFQLYQVPGLVILGAVFMLAVIARRKSPAVTFGLSFMAVAMLPTSNFIVPSGILLAERALFLPSVGMLIAIGGVVPWLYGRARVWRVAGLIALPTILILGAWRSTSRTRDWKDNDTLFTRAVADEPFVYRAHYMLGAWDIAQNRKPEGEREYRLAIALFDHDPGLFFTLGEQYMRARMFTPAIDMFQRSLAIDSSKVEARVRLAMSLAELGRWQDANREAMIALRQNTNAAKAMLSIMRWASAASKHPGALDAGLAGISFDSTGLAKRPVSPPATDRPL
jgi:hypothetical protein